MMQETTITAKEYLRQAYKIETKINADLEHIGKLKDLATKATTIIADERVSSTPAHNKVDSCVSKVIDLQDELKANIARLVDIKRDIKKIISSVNDDNLAMLLTLRYINYNSWEEIASKLYYTERWVHKLHSDALTIVDKMLGSSQQFIVIHYNL